MKQIGDVYKLEDSKHLIDLYFEAVEKDPFLKSTATSIGVFKSQIPKLVPQLAQKTKNEGKGKWT